MSAEGKAGTYIGPIGDGEGWTQAFSTAIPPTPSPAAFIFPKLDIRLENVTP